MKKLNEDVLEVGDVILATTHAKDSKGIRFFTVSDISHAMIYVESHSVVDATKEGVHARNTQRIVWEEEAPVHVLRLYRGLMATELAGILKFIRTRVGTPYTVREAISTILGPKRSWSRKQFCSRLVAQAYADVGIPLVKNPNYCSPEDLKSSSVLIEVPDSTMVVDPEYLEALAAEFDFTELMRTMINAILEGVRKLDPNVHDLNDVNRFLLENREHDLLVAALFKYSGYLDAWAEMRDAHPWQLSLRVLESIGMPEEEKRSYCLNVVGNIGAATRYRDNISGYADYCRKTGLTTFMLLRDLNQNMWDLHNTYYAVATAWLSKHGS